MPAQIPQSEPRCKPTALHSIRETPANYPDLEVSPDFGYQFLTVDKSMDSPATLNLPAGIRLVENVTLETLRSSDERLDTCRFRVKQILDSKQSIVLRL